ncbi:hypothetical protein F5B20DRAFT_595935 [Whalleya microplaca]|nr:hypothetical protein F5B20DRAFT_595935 [Whalleya microplaca]
MKTAFLNNALDASSTIDCENHEENTIKLTLEEWTVQITQFRDVVYTDRLSYYNSHRAQTVESKSQMKMDAIEDPNSTEKKKFYEGLRTRVIRSFWMEWVRDERDRLRKTAKTPSAQFTSNINIIEAEDRSRSQDFFYQHFKDSAAVADADIYCRIEEDVFILLDKNGDILVGSVSCLFQTLFGSTTMDKVTDAIRKWTTITPLPAPDTARHMVDEIKRREHPELDIELATTIKELEERAMCVVHLLHRAVIESDGPDYPNEILPKFRRGVLGLTSEVARFLVAALAPKYYDECIESWDFLPEEKRLPVSEPNWSTLMVLGYNSFTERHADSGDLKFGFAVLVALGAYEGGDMCFPQLGLKLDYKPGCCMMFRGAELQHFVADWTGNRIFLIYTNQQAVRNYIDRRRGRLRPLPDDDPLVIDGLADTVVQLGEQPGALTVGENDDNHNAEYEYYPCVELNLDNDLDKDLTDKEIHRPGTWSPWRNLYDTSSSDNSSQTPSRKDDGSFAASLDLENDEPNPKRPKFEE